MQGFTTTIQLPDDLVSAIKAEVNNSFVAAQEALAKGNQYPPYMNLKDTAKYLGVSYNNLRKIVANHDDFPITSLNGTYRVNRLALDKFMLDNK
ncbi:MAG: helix-turn-helix domain-containing protein [Limosilactobacillus oris]|jgi:uncharacterized protein with PIN domain|uniref:helix-turn-helix domain-containing protein n=1 Tax=Limosilactobacillus oris TaxID=1632 RepID=UPI00242F2220|nr:helix-turn-helix domain-containing protein [Limosilactobacillus oris]MCH3911289.1 helix-turn-helix domain-containing protein [Limosilactobacillus oris]MCH3938539.1 helix-turn-helix domain-containing protein [Limosilactobacillus oris]MCI1980286.1 helix-turn-helix domain-containing protein [Limosilactobacillus oris]MCI2042643.1 helix-turn-helix domain-containing protein [Limosilactobacillus oris]